MLIVKGPVLIVLSLRKQKEIFSVEDPGFPKGSANSRGWCASLLFRKIFAKNCIKMKESGPWGVAGAPLDPPRILLMMFSPY